MPIINSREHISRQLQSQLPAKVGEWPSAEKLPLIYHPRHNISFFGIEKLHPFDAQKYGRIVAGLTDAKLVHTDQARHMNVINAARVSQPSTAAAAGSR